MNKFTKNQKKNEYFSKISKLFALFLVIMLPLSAMAKNTTKTESKLIQTIQTNRITLKLKNKSLEEILSSICKQANVQYIVKSGVVLSGNKSIDVKDTTVEGTLNKLLANTSYSYSVEDESILITNKPEPLLLTSLQTDEDKLVGIYGRVYDEDNKPVVGATAIVEGTSIGAITDPNGSFYLRTKIGSKVTVSFVGYLSQTVNVNEKDRRYNIVLAPDELEVEDVIVTGYGTVNRESFTGSATTVTQEQLLAVNPTNVLSALQVFDPSFRFVTNNEMGSDPNTMPEFYIRGQSGISGTTELDELTGSTSEYSLTTDPNCPVFILDGYEVSMTIIYDMDPMRIKSMTILKDAASTAIYGSRAANGVIVVETVAPKPGKFNVSYSFTGSVTAPDLTSYNLMNAQEKLDTEVAAGLLLSSDNADAYESYEFRLAHYRLAANNIAQGVDTYWLSFPLQTAFNQNHSITLDGGTDELRYGFTLGYSGTSGVMKESYRDNYSGSFNMNYKVNNKLRISNSITFSLNDSENSSYGSFSDYTCMQPYYSPYDLETGELVESFYEAGITNQNNPLYDAQLNSYSISDYYNIAENFSVDYYFNDNLRFTGQFSTTITNSNSESFTDPDDGSMYNVDDYEKGTLSIGNTVSNVWNVNAVLQYNKSIEKHNINARLGYNAQNTHSEGSTYTYKGFTNSLLVSPSFASTLYSESLSDNTSRLLGAFLAVNYSYNNIYLMDLSARADGSSEFGSNNRYAPFWSLGTGINIHNYDFMKDNTVFNSLRVTANYGQTGKVNFYPYMAENAYEIYTDGWYLTGIGTTVIARGNSDLTWEKTNSLNVGFDASVLDKRLNFSFDVYNKRTVDLVSSTSIPLSTGFTSYKDNIGEVENKGYEFNVSYAVIKKKDMGLTLSVNGSHNVGTILSISDTQKAYNDAVIAYFEEYSVYTSNTDPILQYVEGGSLTSIFGCQSLGISPATGEELFLAADGTVTTEWESVNQTIIGNTEPDLAGTIALSFNYKRFSVFTTFMYSIGGDIYNSTLANSIEGVDLYDTNVDYRVYEDRWKEVGDDAQYTKLSLKSTTVQPTSRFVQNENYLKFNSLSASYTLNNNWLKDFGVSMCRLTVSMNDVFVLSTIQQERGTSYPYSRTFNFSAKISF